MKHIAFPCPDPGPSPGPGPCPGPGQGETPAADERAAIAHLRGWLHGDARRSQAAFGHGLRPDDGAAAAAAFAVLMRALAARDRPFACRAPGSSGFSSDERAFARFLATAASGEEDAATRLALHLFHSLPPSRLLGSAARAGLALRHIAESAARPDSPGPSGRA